MKLLDKQDKNSIGLIGHTIIDYPNPELARAAIDIMVAAGVDLIECQIPFSEPVADGPTFMHANYAALEQGVTVEQCFEFMYEVTKKHKVPFVFMTYVNIVYVRGFKNFVKQAKEVGASGAIVPDLPVELADDYLQACLENNFATPHLVPPNVDDNRLLMLLNACRGFVYAVARSGVTGSHSDMNNTIISHINRIKAHTELPVAVGFGIQKRDDIEFLKPYADYAIVGTQALRVLHSEGLEGLKVFWQKLAGPSIVASG